MLSWFIGMGVTAIVLIIVGLIVLPFIITLAFGGKITFTDILWYICTILFIIVCIWFITIGVSKIGTWMLYITRGKL